MTPAARIQTAIEILDQIAAAARDGGAPADAIFAEAMRARRYAGSKDRRAIRELVYAAIRAVRSAPDSGRAAMLALADTDADMAALFDGAPYAPAPITADEPRAELGLAAQALIELFDPLIGAEEHAAMLDRAPLDLRANRTRIDRSALAEMLGAGDPIAATRDGLRLPAEFAAAQTPAFADGLFEVQDAASQIAAEAVGAVDGMTIVDLCAGAGGKTLALAAAAPGARIIACDINRARLQQLGPRAARAGAANIETRLLNPGQESAMLSDLIGGADAVIVDAPCSGSGTWRRSPELRWRLTPQRLARHRAEQAALLALGATLMRTGGVLIYATCSVLAGEGRAQIAAFLDAQNGACRADFAGLPTGIGRRAGDGLLLTPHHDGTDGFYLARLQTA
jgi:16S rRNA (cytosine967-C5)-methyltransferase